MNFRQNESAQKLRGGYYTPPELAAYLAGWAIGPKAEAVLEPSCGDGVFLDALQACAPRKIDVTAIEVDALEAAKAARRSTSHDKLVADVKCADFLEWYLGPDARSARFDAVVGNPPFIRYQYLSNKDQALSEKIFSTHGLPFTKHTNAWVPFVIASLSLLKPGGRMAMVLPSEILHVLHAQSLRSFLGAHCEKILIIDPEEILFEGTLQGAVLFFAEKKLSVRDHSSGLGIVRTSGKGFLKADPDSHFSKTSFLNGKTVEGKWTKALLGARELELFEHVASLPSVHKFAEIASVDVGLVTGANKFFLVASDVVKKFALDEWAHPMFGRSEHCPGVLYDERQHRFNSDAGLPSNFLWFNVQNISELPPSAIKYIQLGESEELHTRYKCRVRSPWFKVPSVYSTTVGMLKRAHDMPRLIYNDIGAYTTDTAYRITTNIVDPKRLVDCFVNSFTALSAELEGRYYGGGVLELVPSEIERVLVPMPLEVRPAIRSLDNMVRTSPTLEVLEKQDSRILPKLGLSQDDAICLRGAWNKLRQRRQRSQGGASQ